MEPVFKIINDHIYPFVKRFPMFVFALFIIALYLPSFVSLVVGGTFLVGEIDYRFAKFSYGYIPVTFTLFYIILIPFYFYFKSELSKDASAVKNFATKDEIIADDIFEEVSATYNIHVNNAKSDSTLQKRDFAERIDAFNKFIDQKLTQANGLDLAPGKRARLIQHITYHKKEFKSSIQRMGTDGWMS